MGAGVKSKRTYRMTLREEQAGLTRGRILETARRLLISGGYTQVTMQDLAKEAGVAYQTLYAHFRNKNLLAVELCASEFPHVGQTVALLTEARDRADPEAWLLTLGPFARRMYEPCARVLRFMRVSGDPELMGRYEEIEEGRLRLLRELGPQLEQTGRLRKGLSGAEAVDLAWFIAGPETYERMVLERGWSPDRFEGWLGPALVDLLLDR